MSRRTEFAKRLPTIVSDVSDGDPIHIREIYSAVERVLPHLVDDEREPSGALRWKHELRWVLETLVIDRTVQRRKDLGRGIYTALVGERANDAGDELPPGLWNTTHGGRAAVPTGGVGTRATQADSAIAVGAWGAGFGTPEHNRLVEEAAMRATTQYFRDWIAHDVSKSKCGWDITFAKAGSTDLHIEVKGVSGVQPVLLLTANEFEASMTDPQWKLAVVTQALAAPLVVIYPAEAVRATARPTVYRVSL